MAWATVLGLAPGTSCWSRASWRVGSKGVPGFGSMTSTRCFSSSFINWSWTSWRPLRTVAASTLAGSTARARSKLSMTGIMARISDWLANWTACSFSVSSRLRMFWDSATAYMSLSRSSLTRWCSSGLTASAAVPAASCAPKSWSSCCPSSKGVLLMVLIWSSGAVRDAGVVTGGDHAGSYLLVALEHILEFVEEGLALGQGRSVLGAGELAEELALFLGQLAGHFDEDLHELVTVAGRAEVGQTLALELEDLAVLRAGGDVHLLGAFQRRDV